MIGTTKYAVEQRVWVHNLAADVLEQYKHCIELGDTEYRKTL